MLIKTNYWNTLKNTGKNILQHIIIMKTKLNSITLISFVISTLYFLWSFLVSKISSLLSRMQFKLIPPARPQGKYILTGSWPFKKS